MQACLLPELHGAGKLLICSVSLALSPVADLPGGFNMLAGLNSYLTREALASALKCL